MSSAAVLAAVALAGLLAGFGGGWKVQAWRWAAADGARAEAQAEAQRLQARVADEAATRHEAEKAAIAAQRRTITREFERVITLESAPAAAVCIGPDGMRLLEAAATGRAVDPGQPAPTVPGASAAAPDGTGAAVLRTMVEWAGLYRECADRHRRLSEAVAAP